MEKTVVKQESGTSPAEMIREAVTGGADLEKLEKLLALQERWEANEARKAYHEAMSDFKANPPKIIKNRKVAYDKTKYNYASLAKVASEINRELSKYGLNASWKTSTNGHISVTCRITHIMGHSEETTLTADADKTGSKNSIQAMGSTISYLERYTILALTGLATEEQDDDGISSEPKISNEQLSTLRDILIELGDESKEGAFAKYLGVEKLADLRAVDYKKAVAALDAKKHQKASKK